MKLIMKAALLASATFAASQAYADPVVLTFEGLGNLEQIGSYYGPDYVFSSSALALIDADAGGTGNTANEPSGQTTMVFLDADNAILNVTNGFDTGFSFFYSSNSTNGFVNVWSGADATGTLLGTISLAQQFNDNCAGDPNGLYCNWSAGGVAFAGTAMSIDFGGTANYIVFDNITFGDSNPGGGAVPEPATWAMMMLGFGAMGAALRRRSDRKVRVRFAA